MGVISFQPLDPALSRAGFDCGNAVINTWFREQAGQSHRKNGTRTTLGLATLDSAIASFFTLVTHRIELNEAAQSKVYSSRAYPIPAMLIAQLAVDRRYQGKGIGALTLGRALGELAAVSETVGFEVVLVDAIDEAAFDFYAKYGFTPLLSDGRRLALTTRDLLKSAQDTVA